MASIVGPQDWLVVTVDGLLELLLALDELELLLPLDEFELLLSSDELEPLLSSDEPEPLLDPLELSEPLELEPVWFPDELV